MTTGSERRAERRRRAESHQRWRRRRRVVLIVAPFVIAGAVFAYVATRPDLRAGSEPLEGGSVEVASNVLDGYHVVYRDENRAADDLVLTTVKIWVRRPFDSRAEVWTGEPPGTELVSTQVGTRTALGIGGPDGIQTVIADPPGPANGDHRFDLMLAPAFDQERMEQREVRRVLGRTCRVVRTNGAPGAGALNRLAADPEEYTDRCIDGDGLVLEEVWFAQGRMMQRKLAVEIDAMAPTGDELFAIGEQTIGADQGGGSVRPVAPDSRPPGTFFEAQAAPDGSEHVGRYAVVPPQQTGPDPALRASMLAFVSDVWVRGVDVIVFEQGATREGTSPFGDDPSAEDVQVAGLGEGEILVDTLSSEVRLKLDGGRFVRVLGTAPRADLLAILEGLEEVPGGSLVYVDEGAAGSP